MGGTDEKLLLKALRSKDETVINNAFEKIYYDYVKLIAFVVGKYIHNAETVKEIVNETFFRLFSNADRVHSSVRSYLTSTAKNLSLDYLDRTKNTLPLEDFINLAEEPRHSADYDEVVSSLKKFLHDEEVEIILLHLIEGLTFREIAARLNKKQNSVISTYNRAVKKYRKEAKQ